jgi:putative hydrolase of the HAD superfamily
VSGSRRPALLVLDLGGVVFPSAMPQVIRELAELSGQGERRLWRHFNNHVFQAFWSGRMSVEEFWEGMTAFAGVPGTRGRWQTEMTERILAPRAALARLADWARVVPLGILSNHRAEWVRPALEAHGVMDLFGPVLISSETGLVKPDPQAFRQLADLGPAPEDVLYVDDRPGALRRAEWFHIRTMEADAEDRWIERLEAVLGL